MARPQKQTVDYFPHDANASDSDTLTVLQGRWGNDGYAFWFRLLEKLASSEGHVIDCRNPIKWQLLLAKTQLSEVTGEEIMKTLSELNAIDPDLWSEHRLIWCQDLVDNIADVYKNRRRPTPVRPVITKQNTITTGDNTQSKLKYSKVNKNIVDVPSFIAYKEKLRNLYPKLDIEEEWERCQIWYRDHNKLIKSPSLALGNWCKKEMEIKQKGDQGGAHREHSTKLPARNSYTKPRPNPQLDKLVEQQQRAAGSGAGRDEPG